jgi:hypothetical protein
MGPKHTLPAGGVTSSAELPSSILKGSEDWEADVMDKYSIGKEGKSKIIDPVRKGDSVSILEQFFGNVLSKSGSNLPTYVEVQQEILFWSCLLLFPNCAEASNLYL